MYITLSHCIQGEKGSVVGLIYFAHKFPDKLQRHALNRLYPIYDRYWLGHSHSIQLSFTNSRLNPVGLK